MTADHIYFRQYIRALRDEAHLRLPSKAFSLGIGKAIRRENNGISLGGTGLHLRSMDMAMLGYYCCNGHIEEKTVIPSSWITESTRVHSVGILIGLGTMGFIGGYPLDPRTDGQTCSSPLDPTGSTSSSYRKHDLWRHFGRNLERSRTSPSR